MRRTPIAILAALLLVLLVAPSAGAADLRPRWVDTDFGTGVPDQGWRLWGWSGVRSGHDGPGLASWMNVGEHGAAGGHVDLRGLSHRGSLDEAWFRYWLRLDDDFYLQPPSQGKLPGLAGINGTYRCMGGKLSRPDAPCFSARTVFSRTNPRWGQPGYPYGPDDRTRLGTYLYHLDVPPALQPYGEAVLWDPDVATLEHGRWYCVEGHLRLNTPGRRDGVVQAFVDEERALRRDDLRFRRSGEGRLGVETLWMDLYHGGRIPSAADNEVRVDSLAVGPQRIGCADGAAHRGRFSDDDRSDHEDDVEWLVDAGLTGGCHDRRDDLFCPADAVTRSQAAQFLADALELPDGTARFRDVSLPRAVRATSALAASGATRGCAPHRYCPRTPLTRAQLALMVDRLLELPTTDARLADVDPGTEFGRAISGVVALDVMRPCGARRFCPTGPATREVVADVVRRLVDLDLDLAPALDAAADGSTSGTATDDATDPTTDRATEATTHPTSDRATDGTATEPPATDADAATGTPGPVPPGPTTSPTDASPGPTPSPTPRPPSPTTGPSPGPVPSPAPGASPDAATSPPAGPEPSTGT